MWADSIIYRMMIYGYEFNQEAFDLMSMAIKEALEETFEKSYNKGGERKMVRNEIREQARSFRQKHPEVNLLADIQKALEADGQVPYFKIIKAIRRQNRQAKCKPRDIANPETKKRLAKLGKIAGAFISKAMRCNR